MINSSNLLFRSDAFDFRRLNKDNNSLELHGFFKRNRQFFLEVENTEPTIQVAEESLSGVPEGLSPEQKYCIGVYIKNELSSYIELIKDRHKPSEWLLSLILIDSDQRKKGLGKQILKMTESWLVESASG